MVVAAELTFGMDDLVAPVRAVDALMHAALRGRAMPENLREAIEYALLGGGKRLRPMLTVWSSAAVGGRVDAIAVQASAAAVEMIHAFSLVHDDLPAMDDDDLRRGRPTLHRHAGEAMAILAGDAMMPLAVELLTQKVSPASLACEVIRELCTATNDMISGQVYDTMPTFNAATPDMERLRTIHRHKTGALLRASCRAGALCGGATPAQLEAITQYAEAAGLMFQVVDDLLDVTATTQQLGKAAGKDQGQGKLTYPGVYGVDASRAEVEHLHAQAVAAIEPLGEAAEPLRRLCGYLAARQK